MSVEVVYGAKSLGNPPFLAPKICNTSQTATWYRWSKLPARLVRVWDDLLTSVATIQDS
jgi:hypothetical protein